MYHSRCASTSYSSLLLIDSAITKNERRNLAPSREEEKKKREGKDGKTVRVGVGERENDFWFIYLFYSPKTKQIYKSFSYISKVKKQKSINAFQSLHITLSHITSL